MTPLEVLIVDLYLEIGSSIHSSRRLNDKIAVQLYNQQNIEIAPHIVGLIISGWRRYGPYATSFDEWYYEKYGSYHYEK